jgi:protein-disulfide isomerase
MQWNEGAGVAWADEDNQVPVSSRDPMWGSRLAPVTIVLFSDFECPFCGKLETTLTSLRTQYGPEKLRIVWKNNPLPFHKQAKPTSVAAMTVFELGGSKAFWQFHQSAFANMKTLTPENYERWAQEAGVDMVRYAALSGASPTASAKVEADLALGKTVGVTGTPACLINGILLSGAVPIEKFQTIIDEQLRAAQTAASAGTRADQIYNKLTRDNKGKNPPPKEKDPEVVDDKLVWKIPVGESPARGPDTALVTIVEFSEFQCPFCAKVEPTLDTLRETYGGKLRIVWKHNPLPFHKDAVPAAQLSIEAHRQKGDEGFWKAHDLLFKNQQKLSEQDLIGYGATLGLSAAGVRRAVTSASHPLINADQGLADDVKAGGTPHFFINGRRLTGAQPLEKFKTIIDEEIVKANGLLARGVAARDLYAELIKDGKSGDPLERKTLAPPPAEAPFRGAAGAPVVIHQFSDFQCPFCKRVEPTMDQVLEEYGSKVKIVWRHKPLAFHKEAQLAAEAAQEAYSQRGNAGFQQYHKILFENQTALQRDSLEQYAERMGLNMAKFRQALDSRKHKAFVESEIAASDKVGISGTPAFVINGYYVSGAQPYTKFKKVIDRALADSRAN